MCVCPVLAPHGRPAPPAPATRLSHHQTQAHDHSRRRARRSAPLTAVSAHCTSACTFFRHHTAPERDATGKTLHREARAAARRARRPPSSRYVTRAGLLCSLHAHSTEHMQGAYARRAVPAQRCSPHPATVACLTSSPRMCRTQYCAHCTRYYARYFLFATKRKQKTGKQRERLRRASSSDAPTPSTPPRVRAT